MNSAFKIIIVVTVGGILALWLGVSLGSGDFAMPILITVITAVLLLSFIGNSGVRLEALLLASLIGMYSIGGRGFANLSLTPPLYVGELVLAGAGTLVIIRVLIARCQLVPKSMLSTFCIALMIFATIRLLFFDFAAYRLDAVRDFALIYYMGFLFIGYSIGESEDSRNFILKLFAISLLWVPIYVAITHLAGIDFWFHFLIRGTPLIFHKGDLLVVLPVCAIVYFGLRKHSRETGWSGTMALLISFAMITIVLVLFQVRAGWVSLAFVMLMLFVAGLRKLVYANAAIGIFGFIVLAGLLVSNVRIQLPGTEEFENPIEVIAEHAMSFFDPSGNKNSSNSSATNRYRISFYKSVVKDAMEASPMFGAGFGLNFAKRFVHDEWEVTSGGAVSASEEYSTRSPHSVHFTVFGRLGFLGIFLFGGITIVFFKDCILMAVGYRRGKVAWQTLACFLIPLAFYWIATFGVVLEGPMGAIPFWTFLGLAMASKERDLRASAPVSEPVESVDDMGLQPAMSRLGESGVR